MRLRPFPASNSADKLHNTKIICAMAGPSMFVMIEALERPERKLQQWQLRLLCFAVTRDPDDRAAAFSFAAELDALGRDGYRGFSFFFRTSWEVCDAILASGHQRSEATLRRHASRIEDPQLRRAFRSAVGLPEIARPRQQPSKGAPLIGSGSFLEPLRGAVLADR